VECCKALQEGTRTVSLKLVTDSALDSYTCAGAASLGATVRQQQQLHPSLEALDPALAFTA